MARRRTDSEPATATDVTPARPKGVTPPKGRPTRPRNGARGTKRAFGPVAQWATVAVLVLLVVVALILVTDGGDFNPFNDDDELPSQFGSSAVVG